MATIRYPKANLGAGRKPRISNRAKEASDQDLMKAFAAGLAVMGVAAAVSARLKNPALALAGLLAGTATTAVLIEREHAEAATR